MFDEEYAYRLLAKTTAYTEKEFAEAIFSKDIDRSKLVKYCIKHINKEYYKQFNVTESFAYNFITIYFRDVYDDIFYYDKQFIINLIKFYKYLHSISLKGLSKEEKDSLIIYSVLGILSVYKRHNIPNDIFEYFMKDIKEYTKYSYAYFKHYFIKLIFRKPITDKFYKAGLKDELDDLFKKLYKDVPYISMYNYKELPYHYFHYYIMNEEPRRLTNTSFNRIFHIANDEDKLELFKRCKHNLTIVIVVNLLEKKLSITVENEIMSFFAKRLGKISYLEKKEEILAYPWSNENKEKLESLILMYDLQD